MLEIPCPALVFTASGCYSPLFCPLEVWIPDGLEYSETFLPGFPGHVPSPGLLVGCLSSSFPSHSTVVLLVFFIDVLSAFPTRCRLHSTWSCFCSAWSCFCFSKTVCLRPCFVSLRYCSCSMAPILHGHWHVL